MSGVRVRRIDQHAFCGANAADGVVNVERGGIRLALKVTFQVCVFKLYRGVEFKIEGDAADQESVPFSRIEDTRSIAEVAFARAEGYEVLATAVERANGDKGVRHFLAVSADVLNRRCSNRPRNPGKTFHPGEACSAGTSDQVVPLVPRGYVVTDGCGVDFPSVNYLPRGPEAEHYAGVAAVGDEQVGAAAKDERRQREFAGELDARK